MAAARAQARGPCTLLPPRVAAVSAGRPGRGPSGVDDEGARRFVILPQRGHDIAAMQLGAVRRRQVTYAAGELFQTNAPVDGVPALEYSAFLAARQPAFRKLRLECVQRAHDPVAKCGLQLRAVLAAAQATDGAPQRGHQTYSLT